MQVSASSYASGQLFVQRFSRPFLRRVAEREGLATRDYLNTAKFTQIKTSFILVVDMFLIANPVLQSLLSVCTVVEVITVVSKQITQSKD